MRPYFSVIIPVYNERENIPRLLEKLDRVFTKISRPGEAVVVDDGSTDGSTEILRSLKPRYPWLKVVILRRNFGQSAAFTAGIDHAQGEILVTMDGDLQNDPEDIPAFWPRSRRATIWSLDGAGIVRTPSFPVGSPR